MKITILHGSPKKKLSHSREYVRFIEKNFPEYEYSLFEIGKDIDNIVNNSHYFDEILRTISESDGVLWLFPVYYALVPAHLMRFINMVFEQGKEAYFKNVYTTFLTTSAYFFDYTALRYMRSVSEDLGMKVFDGFSGQGFVPFAKGYMHNVTIFFSHFFDTIEKGVPVTREFYPCKTHAFEYSPGNIEAVEKTEQVSAVLISDVKQDDVNLTNMVDTFIKKAPYHVDHINLHDIDMKGCVACLHCTYDNECKLNKDFCRLCEDVLQKADIIIFAGTIRYRYLSILWKLFFDSSFFNNHIPLLMNKQFSFLISGPLNENTNIRDALEAIMHLYELNFTGFISDQNMDCDSITAILEDVSHKLFNGHLNKYKKNQTFLGVGGRKVLRDLIAFLGYPLTADYRYYKKSYFYSFPHKYPIVFVMTAIKNFFRSISKDKFKNIHGFKNKSFAGFCQAILNEDNEND